MTGTEYDVTISLATMWADVCVLRDASCVEGKWVEWLQCCKEIKADIAGDCLSVIWIGNGQVVTIEGLNFTTMWYLPLFSRGLHLRIFRRIFACLFLSSCVFIVKHYPIYRFGCIWLNMRTVWKMSMSVLDTDDYLSQVNFQDLVYRE